MCDGTYQYPTKGGTPVQLTQPLIIICGNSPPQEVYPKKHPFVTARFKVIQVDKKECQEIYKEIGKKKEGKP